MTITLGRASIANDPYAKSVRMSGDVLTFKSAIINVTAAEASARVQQLRGLMDNADEDTFPCTFSADATLDGFYRDIQVTVEDEGTAYLTVAYVPFTVSMRRVAGAAAAQFENTAGIVTMTNGLGLPTIGYTLAFALPYSDLEAESFNVIGTANYSDIWATGTTLTTDDGLVRVGTLAPNAPPIRARWRWATTPALTYEGSAKFEQSFGGSYYPLHGQQVLKSSNAWRISNGLVRVSLSATKIQVSHYDGSWDTAKEWTLAGGASYTQSAVKSVRVLANTPVVVIVRVSLYSSSTANTISLFISLRRGMRFASFYTDHPDGAFAWTLSNAEAGTALTGGFRATSTDASGNRYVVGSPLAQTNTLASGILAPTASTAQFLFVIGSEVGADGSGQTLLNWYITAVSEVQRVVSR